MGMSLAIRPPPSWTVRSAKPLPPLNLRRLPSSALTPGRAAAAARISRPLMSLLRCSGGDDKGSTGGELVRTLLIDNYDSYTYNIYQELSVVNGVAPVVVHNNEWTWDYFCYYLYEEKAFDNIVISPGPGSPTCPKDIGICLQILLECKDIPILGVCLGHQALGLVHGAQIVHAPEPVHGRLSEIEHAGCDLFDHIPSGRKSGFKVVRYHSLVINEGSLPKELIPIAWTSSSSTQSFLETQQSGLLGPSNSHDFWSKKILMGIMHSSRPHYGVQFHPESIATCHGRQIFKNFKKMTVDYGLISSPHHETKVHHRGNPNFEALERRGRKYVWKDNNIQSDQSVMSDYVSRAYQSYEELSKMGLYRNRSMSHQQAVWGNGTLPIKSVDDKFFRLNWKKIDCLVNQVGGSENIFFELFSDENAKDTFWLDSSSTDRGRARFSFMGGKGGPLWRYISFELSDKSNLTANVGGRLSIQDSHGSVKTTFLEDGFFDFLNKELQSFHYDEADYKELPFDFCGGYVGFIGYNLKAECGALANHHKSTTPDACLFFADNLVAIDHSNGDVYILSIQDNSLSGISWGVQERTWLRDTEKRLRKLKATPNKKIKTQESWVGSPIPSKEVFIVDKSRHEYIRDVEKCLKLITDGESYELCLTTQMRRRIRDINALNLYLHLRKKNPAPYAAWLNFAREDLCICSSSPERFLRLDRKEILEAKPIKGTIARGRTPEEDENLRLQLQYSEKDQAENLMIVDLLRNDLGRVCEPGSVCVPRLMDVESYATVHTMVSTIQGKKKPNSSPIDCVRASFPGGSMTGAPKLRSMEILDSLENCSRGVYSGSIGFFSYNQTFDLNIVIRTVVIHKGEASVGAGGAIVALSNPEDEYAEMMLKAKVPTKVVEECCSKGMDCYDTTVKMVK